MWETETVETSTGGRQGDGRYGLQPADSLPALPCSRLLPALLAPAASSADQSDIRAPVWKAVREVAAER